MSREFIKAMGRVVDLTFRHATMNNQLHAVCHSLKTNKNLLLTSKFWRSTATNTLSWATKLATLPYSSPMRADISYVSVRLYERLQELLLPHLGVPVARVMQAALWEMNPN